MIEQIKNQVFELLSNDNSGHGKDHIARVLALSLRFAQQEQANIELVTLIALLHDVDDYKLFGYENAENLPNARRIMDNAHISGNIKDQVLEALKTIGYSKRLHGIVPQTIEAKVVSDADMCDAIGANGILRTYAYSMKNGRPFFGKDIFPIEDMSSDKYTRKSSDSCVCHIFEKLLKLKDLMLTTSGGREAIARHQIIVEFLYHLFEEENANDWKIYLDNYLEGQKTSGCIRKA